MRPLLDAIGNTAGAVLAAVLNDFWLVLAVAGAAWLALELLTRARVSGINAATRYWIWWVVLGVVMILPLAPQFAEWWTVRELPMSPHSAEIFDRPVPVMAPVVQRDAVVTVTQERGGSWPLWLFGVWTAVSLFRLSQLVRSYVFLRNVKQRASLSSIELPDCGIHRPVSLLVSEEIDSPMAVGYVRPAVIFPGTLLKSISEPERNYVLLHELAHIARFDDWTHLAARLLGGVLGLHPIALWILRQIEREREMACDDFVVARTGEARTYASSLARLYELSRARGGHALATGIFGGNSKLGDRIEMVLRRGRDFSPRTSLARVASSGVVLLGFVLAGTVTSRWIAFAQQLEKPQFEVASVKRNTSDDVRGDSQFQFLPGGRLVIRNIPLTLIGAVAYDTPRRSFQLAASEDFKRLAGERYDIEAVAAKETLPANLSSKARQDHMKLMLQALLEDRFKMVVRKEAREQPVYTLVVARDGPKLEKSKRDCSQSPTGPMETCYGITGGLGRGIHSEATTIAEVARFVEFWADRPVIDKTGLTDLYNIQTEGWAPMQPRPAPPEGRQGGDVGLDDPDRPTLADVFRKLGLILESQKAVVDMYVVEHVERPSGN